MDLIAYAVPLFILAIGLELAWGLAVRRNTYRLNDSIGSLFLGVLSQARRFVTLGVCTAAVAGACHGRVGERNRASVRLAQ